MFLFAQIHGKFFRPGKVVDVAVFVFFGCLVFKEVGHGVHQVISDGGVLFLAVFTVEEDGLLFGFGVSGVDRVPGKLEARLLPHQENVAAVLAEFYDPVVPAQEEGGQFLPQLADVVDYAAAGFRHVFPVDGQGFLMDGDQLGFVADLDPRPVAEVVDEDVVLQPVLMPALGAFDAEQFPGHDVLDGVRPAVVDALENRDFEFFPALGALDCFRGR